MPKENTTPDPTPAAVPAASPAAGLAAPDGPMQNEIQRLASLAVAKGAAEAAVAAGDSGYSVAPGISVSTVRGIVVGPVTAADFMFSANSKHAQRDFDDLVARGVIVKAP